MSQVNIDELVNNLALEKDISMKQELANKIVDAARGKGIFFASIHDLYIARGRGEVKGFTVPAINLRGLTYDLARAIFRVANKHKVGLFIFEIAKSEMAYTDQRPIEYASVCLAAALKEGYAGPVFVQGDHFQVNAKKYKENPEVEVNSLKKLIDEAVAAGYYNIDIDSSTLVDLNKPNLAEEQRLNFEVCAKLTEYIRSIEPSNVVVSVGGEIGEVGKANSTPDELKAFMDGYKAALKKGLTGISKISVQTGTSHGGVVLPDGSVAKVKLDFDTLKSLSELARKDYGMSGAVQHGASTLPAEAFHKFPEVETAEVHLATEFQNMIFDSLYFPKPLKDRIYEWLKAECASEREAGQTDDQFYYKSRKKALGYFKKDITNLDASIREKIVAELEAKFEFLFDQLKIFATKDIADKFIKKIELPEKVTSSMGEFKAHDMEGAD